MQNFECAPIVPEFRSMENSKKRQEPAYLLRSLWTGLDQNKHETCQICQWQERQRDILNQDTCIRSKKIVQIFRKDDGYLFAPSISLLGSSCKGKQKFFRKEYTLKEYKLFVQSIACLIIY